MRRINRLALVLAVIAGSSGAWANPVTRVYDVRDLLIAIPDSPDEAPETQTEKADRLTAMMVTLRQTVPSDQGLSIRRGPGDGSLEVVADENAHAAVGYVLKTARANRARQVMVETRVVRLDQATFNSLEPGLRAALLATEVDAFRDAVPLSAVQAAGLTRLLQNNNAVSTLVAPRITLFSGQQATTAAMTQTAYVAGLNRIAAADGQVGYDTEVATINSGINISVRACADLDRQTAVSMQVKVTELVHLDAVAVEGGMIQKPGVLTRQFDGMFIAPPDTTLVLAPSKISGPTSRPANGTAVLDRRPNDQVGDHTFLLVKPTAIIQREIADWGVVK